jgi:hypothetical protein
VEKQGVKTGNWQAFPLDILVVERKIAIDARALSFLAWLMRGHRNE